MFDGRNVCQKLERFDTTRQTEGHQFRDNQELAECVVVACTPSLGRQIKFQKGSGVYGASLCERQYKFDMPSKEFDSWP